MSSTAVLWWLCGLVLALLCLVAPAAADGPSFDDLVNYPFRNNQDMNRVSNLATELLASPEVRYSQDSANVRNAVGLVIAFTSTDPEQGGSFKLVNFRSSQDKAIMRLRELVRIPAPKGGAILRLYSTRDSMPDVIAKLFNKDTGGLTLWCRFVAVFKENKSPDQLQDTISHELVHAYIASYLGASRDDLPRWFHEGVAQYLSDSKDTYSYRTGMNTEMISWSPQDYANYRLCFRYLDSRLGTAGVDQFVREAVVGRNAEKALWREARVTSFEDLLAKANRWRLNWQLFYIALVLVPLSVVALVLRLRAMHLRNLYMEPPEPPVLRFDHELDLPFEGNPSVPSFEARQKREQLARKLLVQGINLAASRKNFEARKRFTEAKAAAPWMFENDDLV